MLKSNSQKKYYYNVNFSDRPGFMAKEHPKIDALECRFDGLDLKGIDFSGSNLYGSSFQGCNLEAANLTGAVLAKADLSGAQLFGAALSLDCRSFEQVKFDDRQVAAFVWLLASADIRPDIKHRLRDLLKMFDEETLEEIRQWANRENP